MALGVSSDSSDAPSLFQFLCNVKITSIFHLPINKNPEICSWRDVFIAIWNALRFFIPERQSIYFCFSLCALLYRCSATFTTFRLGVKNIGKYLLIGVAWNTCFRFRLLLVNIRPTYEYLNKSKNNKYYYNL